MPICEICGIEVVDVQECKECEAKYCDECGDNKTGLCYDCHGWDEDISENKNWEEQDLN